MDRIFDASIASFRADSAVITLHADQCVQLKNVFPRSQVQAFAAQSEEIFLRGTGNGFDEKYQLAHVEMLEPDPIRRRYALLEMIWRSKAWDVIASYLGTKSILILRTISYMRRVSAERADIAIPYHQDGLALPDGEEYRLLSLWMLLSPETCGRDAPGLEFLVGGPKRRLKFEELPELPVFTGTQSAEAEIAALERSGAAAWLPEIAVGDCMLFSQWNPHRASIAPNHRAQRYSFETRLMADNDATRAYLAQQGTPFIEVLPSLAIGEIDTKGTRGAFPW